MQYTILDAGSGVLVPATSASSVTLPMASNGELRHVERDASGTIITNITIGSLNIEYSSTDGPFTLHITDELLNAGEQPALGSLKHTTPSANGERNGGITWAPGTGTNANLIVEFTGPSAGVENTWVFGDATPLLKLKVRVKR